MGSVGWLLLIALLALAGLAVLAWMWLAPAPGPATVPTPGVRPATPQGVETTARSEDGAAPDLTFATPEGADSQDAVEAPREFSAADFRGKGTIRGSLVLPPGLELPETWELVVGPSRSLAGRERAESRRVERPGTSRDFELTGLSLGGYDVSVEGPGLGSQPVPILLVRGSEQAFVNLAVHKLGRLDGFLLDEDGRPVEDVLVVLEDQNSGQRYSTRSTVTGGYFFHDLPDSEYTIHFGGESHPLIPPEELSFRAPSMRYPPRRMPPLGTLVIHTTDPAGNPIGDATVHGYSPSGGLVETVTDGLGEARVLSLRPGRYTLAGRTVEPAREGRVSVDVHAGFENEIYIALVARE